MSNSETIAAPSAGESGSQPSGAKPDEAKQKYRFSLGSIFTLILTIALCLAWFTRVMLPQDRLREQAVKTFSKYGGMGYSHDWTPWGIDVELDLSHSRIDSIGLRELADNSVVVKLDLSNTEITDDDLQILAEAEALESIRLADTQLSDNAIARLRAARPDLEIILESP